MSSRVQRLIDTEPMRHLASVQQLGLVALVYPGATHNRLEHSIGVYAYARRLCEQLELRHDGFESDSLAQDAFLVASLLHDCGHYPFCHPIEDMALGKQHVGETKIKHESRVAKIIHESDIAGLLDRDWSCSAEDVMAILCPPKDVVSGEQRTDADDAFAFYASCLSGPIDVDKIDYLQRDSLHAGVPYGRNFDPDRILGSLCRHPNEPRLALTAKGRTAAEMMVFSRYVMFSEVYWHHTVRAATAMLQRALFELTTPSEEVPRVSLGAWMSLREWEWIERLRGAVLPFPNLSPLVEGLFGGTRQLYKRLAQFDFLHGHAVHRRLAHRPYWFLVEVSRRLAHAMRQRWGWDIDETQVLVDAPPVKLEVDINIDVIDIDGVATLEDVSPVVSVLARHQFDNHVKRVRVFVAPCFQGRLGGHVHRTHEEVTDLIVNVVDRCQEELA
ncbi:MAG: HD domain-containing protein [Planctomycetota bacterium]